MLLVLCTSLHNNYYYFMFLLWTCLGLAVGECFKQLQRPAGSLKLIGDPLREPSFIINNQGEFVRNFPEEKPEVRDAADEEENPTKEESEEEHKTRDNIKLIQKLTTYLPQHLVGKAKDQIRQMGNVDRIEDFQDRLLVENKQLSKQNMTADPRWEKLENTLSVTHGINLDWKKLGPGMWIY